MSSTKYLKRCVSTYVFNKDLALKDLAKKLGVSRQHLSMVLNDKIPCPQYLLKRLIKLLEVDRDVMAVSAGYIREDWLEGFKNDPESVVKALREVLEPHTKNKKIKRVKVLDKASLKDT